MIKKAKKMISVLLVMALMLMCSVTAFAEENENTVTFEEYAEAIEAEYAKYGLEGGVYEPEEEFICDVEMLEQDLNIVRLYAESVVERAGTPSPHPSNNISSDVAPLSMIGTVTKTATYYYTNLSNPIIPCFCTIQSTSVITVDYQNSHIVSASRPALEIVSGTGIADWIEYVSHSTSINQTRKSVSQTITCKIKQEITLGVSTSWSKIQITYNANYNNISC